MAKQASHLSVVENPPNAKAVAISAVFTQHATMEAAIGRDPLWDAVHYWPQWNAARMALPFIRMEGEIVASYWDVGSSGFSSTDQEIGRRYAAQWLEQAATNPHTPSLLSIVMAMAQAGQGKAFGLDEVAWGFMDAVDAAAMEGWEPVCRLIKSADIPSPAHGNTMRRLKDTVERDKRSHRKG